MATEIDELKETHTWLKKKKSFQLAAALAERLDNIDATKLEPRRQQLLNSFVDIVTDEIQEIYESSVDRYVEADVMKMVELIKSKLLITATRLPLGKKVPTDLTNNIEKATTSVSITSGHSNQGKHTQQVARWAKSAAREVSGDESFAAWHLLVLRHVLLLMRMQGRLTDSKDIPLHSRIDDRLAKCLQLLRELHTESDAQTEALPEREAELAYENQMLGGFIYQLGYASGVTGTAVPVNMFQQTPLDASFGDLVAGSTNCFAIEFKRDIKSLESERKKWTTEGLTSLINEPKLIRASEKCHLLCYGERADQSLGFAAKLYATSIGVSKLEVEMSGEQINTQILGITSSKQPAVSLPTGLPPDELESYLRSLAEIRNSSKGGDRASWLALYVGDGRIYFQMASSLSSLVELISTPDPGTSLEMKVGKRTVK